MTPRFRTLRLTLAFGLLFLGFLSAIGSAQNAAVSTLDEIDRQLRADGGSLTIVCFGDSVTGTYYHTGGRRTYTDMLGIALGRVYPQAKLTMINAGISGHTTANALSRIDRDVLAHQPDLVTVMFGLNDVAKLPLDDYRKNLIEIVDRCRSSGSAVVLCTPNAVIETENRPVEKLTRYCDVVREVAKELKVPLCDSFAEFDVQREADFDSWRLTLSDEIHPNLAGHKAIAEQLTRTISGESVSLDEVGPPPVALETTLRLLAEKKPVQILAMPQADQAIAAALKILDPEAELEITSWPVEGMSRYQIRKDASHRVRKMKPNLVLIAVPREAAFEDREAFIHEQTWITNYAQSFGKQEWDVVIIHPDVFDPGVDSSHEDLIRTVTAAQDLSLIDRAAGDDRAAESILSDWVNQQAARYGAR